MVSTLAAVIGLIAVASYSAGTLLQVRTYRNNTLEPSGLLLAAAVIGATLHGIANYLIVYSGGRLYLGLQTSLSLVSWIMLVFLLLANLRLPLSNLLILVLPAAILGVISLLTAPPESALHVASLSDPLIWHIFISIVAYSILFMAACQSVLLAVVEYRLKQKRTRLLRLLPPLQTMETLLFDLLWAGIVVLTLAIGSGFIFLDDMFEQRVVHHTVLSLASWILYAVLLAGHHLLGWRGTTAVRWTLIAFTLLVLGYFGSKFVIEVLLEG
ncbi:MAG: inner membrane protein YpjD [Pseudomonadales bacterium]